MITKKDYLQLVGMENSAFKITIMWNNKRDSDHVRKAIKRVLKMIISFEISECLADMSKISRSTYKSLGNDFLNSGTYERRPFER